MERTSYTCDFCGKDINKPDFLGTKTFQQTVDGKQCSVSIAVDFPAEDGKPAGSLDACIDCFWKPVIDVVKHYTNFK